MLALGGHPILPRWNAQNSSTSPQAQSHQHAPRDIEVISVSSSSSRSPSPSSARRRGRPRSRSDADMPPRGTEERPSRGTRSAAGPTRPIAPAPLLPPPDSEFLDGLAPEEVAEVNKYKMTLRRKMARLIRYRHNPEVRLLPESEACDRCKEGGWPCWVWIEKPKSALKEFRTPCRTCYKQSCSFAAEPEPNPQPESPASASVGRGTAGRGPDDGDDNDDNDEYDDDEESDPSDNDDDDDSDYQDSDDNIPVSKKRGGRQVTGDRRGKNKETDRRGKDDDEDEDVKPKIERTPSPRRRRKPVERRQDSTERSPSRSSSRSPSRSTSASASRGGFTVPGKAQAAANARWDKARREKEESKKREMLAKIKDPRQPHPSTVAGKQPQQSTPEASHSRGEQQQRHLLVPIAQPVSDPRRPAPGPSQQWAQPAPPPPGPPPPAATPRQPYSGPSTSAAVPSQPYRGPVTPAAAPNADPLRGTAVPSASRSHGHTEGRAESSWNVQRPPSALSQHSAATTSRHSAAFSPHEDSFHSFSAVDDPPIAQPVPRAAAAPAPDHTNSPPTPTSLPKDVTPAPFPGSGSSTPANRWSAPGSARQDGNKRPAPAPADARRDKRRRRMSAYRMLGIRDPDAESWPSVNDVTYNVHHDLFEDRSVGWDVAFPFGTDEGSSMDDGDAENKYADVLRPSELGRVPFLTRVDTITADIAHLLTKIPEGSDVVTRDGNTRLLPPYMYSPRRPCVTCARTNMPCVIADVEAPPARTARRAPLITMIPLPPCLGCLHSEDPCDSCVWMLSLPGQTIHVHLFAVAWPTAEQAQGPDDDDPAAFDERVVWFDPSVALVVDEE